jgi:cytochrome c peroxidase
MSLAAQRRLVVFVGAGLAAVVFYWSFFSDGLPIIWGPSARASEIAAGRELFEREWSEHDPMSHGDGLGPVFNARSCAACHFQGGLGGGGGVEHNAVGFEVFPRPGDPTFHTGTIHNFSVNPAHRESDQVVRERYPLVKGRTIPPSNDCSGPTVIPDFDPVRTQAVQPTALFGAGWIDLISDRAILRNARNRSVKQMARELALEFDSIPVGRVRRLPGGVGKFGWKGQFARLDEFVAAACANELGLGTPDVPQAQPINYSLPSVQPDLDRKQFRSLVAFVKTLPRPVEAVPEHSNDRDAAALGKELFSSIGCAVCHVPDLGGVKGVYSDFLLYTLEDPPPPGGGGYGAPPPPQLQLPPRPEDDPRPDEWKTPTLWGVADSAPYLHDGSARTLRDAIVRHRGDAKSVTERYHQLDAARQNALIAFLGTLKAPPTALGLRDPGVTRLQRKDPPRSHSTTEQEIQGGE